MPRKRWPYLQHERTRHGAWVWYVRKGAEKRIRVEGKFGTPEFNAAYHMAVAGMAEPVRARSGSLRWLIDQYRESAAWNDLSSATRRQRENIFKKIADEHGDTAYSAIKRAGIIASIDKRRDTPAAARHFLDTMRGLFRWAEYAGHVDADPTANLKAPKQRSEGYHTWTDGEVATFEAKWPIGTRERLALDVMLYTGLRRGDAARLGPQHVANGKITIVTEKTKELVVIDMLPPLAASIAAAPVGHTTFIASLSGDPYTKESFGNWFGDVCRATGVPGRAHGLRKAGATRAAEQGATIPQLDAIFGWKNGKTAQIYIKKANRKLMAEAAIGTMLRKA